ncbi:MAG TPA: ROK family protein [Anaerolineaceae bacterium]|nr:ROK family protein [Anaerolineaceae bacterium]
MQKLYGGIEAGGTKFVCMVASSPEAVIEETRFPTTTPAETIQKAADFFRSTVQRGELKAIGIGSFGPVDLDPRSPTYGFITTTPKPGWAFADLCGGIHRELGVPIAFDTDVNAAAFGEHFWIEKNHGLDPFLYMTVGTGIGMGGLVNGKTLHGLIHPEAGHMFIPHDREADPFPGMCPYHGDCLEGLASGPALARRWGQPAETLADEHPAWDLEAEYLASALANLVLAFSPQRIVLGGGVPQHPGLLDLIRMKVRRHLNGYVKSDLVEKRIEELILAPALGSRAGVLGAIAMAVESNKEQ